jgi:hypothetical protein
LRQLRQLRQSTKNNKYLYVDGKKSVPSIASRNLVLFCRFGRLVRKSLMGEPGRQLKQKQLSGKKIDLPAKLPEGSRVMSNFLLL